jgi:hypothetical protein
MGRISVVGLLGALAAALSVAVGAGRSDAAATHPTSTVLGFVAAHGSSVAGGQESMALERFDPTTLQKLAGTRIDVGSGGCAPRQGGEACWGTPAWAYSPDRTMLALARNDGMGVRSLRLVDTAHIRVAADIPLSGGAVGGIAWLTRGRLLALQEVCCSERQRVVVVDLAHRRVQARYDLGGSVVRVADTGGDLVLLLAPAQAIGTARLAVIDGRGVLRSVPLPGILAGTKLLSGASFRTAIQLPGLAVDRVDRVAFVVGPNLVAQVRLGSLSVSYHPSRPTAAAAKGSSGAVRTASWLGGGLLAVTGEQDSFDATRSAQGIAPAGLILFDTRTWTARTLDPSATDVVKWRGLLLATGTSLDSTTGTPHGIGLAAYGSDGGLRFRLFTGELVWPGAIYRGLAYIDLSGPGGRLESRTVDLASGQTVGARPQRLPGLLLGTAAGWWGAD